MFVIRIGHSDFVCKGSYVVHGEKYQIVGTRAEAMKFKKKQSAINYAERMRFKRANMLLDKCEVVELKEK